MSIQLFGARRAALSNAKRFYAVSLPSCAKVLATDGVDDVRDYETFFDSSRDSFTYILVLH